MTDVSCRISEEFDERNRRDNRRQINSGNRQSACRRRTAGIIAGAHRAARLFRITSFAPGDDDVRFSSRTDARGLRVPVRRGARPPRPTGPRARSSRSSTPRIPPRARSRRPSAWNSPSSATRSRRRATPVYSDAFAKPGQPVYVSRRARARVLGAKTRSSRTNEPVHELSLADTSSSVRRPMNRTFSVYTRHPR